MILTVQQRFEVDLPSHWRELPPASVLASDDWLFEWIDESIVASELKESLLESLRDAVHFARNARGDGRSWVAVIDPARGAVHAIASITTIELSETLFPDYAAVATPEYPLAGAIPLFSRSIETTLAGHPAIVVHDIGGFNYDLDGPVMAERYVGTVFPDEGLTALQFEVLAGDLAAFADIVASGNAVLDGLRFAAPELD